MGGNGCESAGMGGDGRVRVKMCVAGLISNSRELFVLLYTVMVCGAWKAQRVSCVSLKARKGAKA